MLTHQVLTVLERVAIRIALDRRVSDVLEVEDEEDDVILLIFDGRDEDAAEELAACNTANHTSAASLHGIHDTHQPHHFTAFMTPISRITSRHS